MATHSSILSWKILWTEEPGELHTVHEVAKSQTRLSTNSKTKTARNLSTLKAFPSM